MFTPSRLTVALSKRVLPTATAGLRCTRRTFTPAVRSRIWPPRPIVARAKSGTASASATATLKSGSKASNDLLRGHTEHLHDTLQPYEPPKTGLLGSLPSSWVPYAELIRLDKPAGTYYLFMPCLFSTLMAAFVTVPVAPISTVLGTTALFFTGALVMRGAGCTVNDLWDRNLDPHVARTRLRPIARGAITPGQAIPYLGAQLAVGLAVLLQFPAECFYYATPSLLLVTIYPLAKRVTNYPQFVLGLTFSWGAFVGFPALGVDLLSNVPALTAAACLYSSCVAWTIVYDMIYAYQDIRDDAKAGIKSIALAHETNAKAFLSAVSTVQVALLASAGYAIGASPIYYIGTCGGAACTLAYMIHQVNLQDVRDCWAWFRRGAWFTGGVISTGLLGEYLTWYLSANNSDASPDQGDASG